MADPAVKSFFDGLEERLNRNPGKLAGMNCVYEFRVGEDAYHVTMKDGKAAVSAGAAASPGCTVSMAEKDFLDLLAGTLNGQMAFMTGKLKVAGDFALALKLENFLRA